MPASLTRILFTSSGRALKRAIFAAAFVARDGQTNPVDTTLSLARAPVRVCRDLRDTLVSRLAIEHGKVIGVYLQNGALLRAKQVVLAGDMWSEFAAQHDIHLPHAANALLVTEPLAAFDKMRPTLRVPDEQAYFKFDAGKLLLGAFELKQNRGV